MTQNISLKENNHLFHNDKWKREKNTETQGDRETRLRQRERERSKKMKTVQEQKRKVYWKLLLTLIFVSILTNIKSILILIHTNWKRTEFHTFTFKLRCLARTPFLWPYIQCHVCFFILHLQCEWMCVYICVCFVFLSIMWIRKE